MAGDRPIRHSRHPSKHTTSGPAVDPMPEAPPLQTHVKPADEATIAYIKRVLCKKPSKPGSLPKPADRDDDSKSLEELLPPLTSSNEMDVQLYAIIAVILNQFVQTWYGRITPDGDFVSEVVKIIAHCTRGIEDRLRRVDVKSLLLDELPGLVDAHLHCNHNHRGMHGQYTGR